MDASGPSEDEEILVSQVEMMSEPRLVTWFVLTLYVAKLRRVRKSWAREVFQSADGVDVGGRSCWLFWLAHKP
jgi:hypothetical protein